MDSFAPVCVLHGRLLTAADNQLKTSFVAIQVWGLVNTEIANLHMLHCAAFASCAVWTCEIWTLRTWDKDTHFLKSVVWGI